MRIIGGEYRSRLISMPKGVEIRPTQDKVRGAVFNILGDINQKTVLDLFAGSGAFGIEAISRGAKHVIFVDNNLKCIQAIKSNLKSLNIATSLYNIIKSNALNVMADLQKESKKFDLVFLDPPYYKTIAKICLNNIDNYDILAPSGFVIVEHFKKDDLTADLKTLKLEKERRYGDTVISIYGKNKDSGISGHV